MVVNDILDLVGSIQKVGSTFLDYIQGDYIFAVQTGKALLFLKIVLYISQIAQFNICTTGGVDHNIANGFNIHKLTFQTDRILRPVTDNGTTRNCQVFTGNSLFNVAESHLRGLHLKNIGIDLNFTFQRPYNVNTGNLFDTFDLVLCNLCKLLQLVEAIISRDIDVHHRKLGNVDVKDLGRIRQIVWQVGL